MHTFKVAPGRFLRKVVLIDDYAPEIINGEIDEESLTKYDKAALRKIYDYVGPFAMAENGERFFGVCEATRLQGNVSEYTFLVEVEPGEHPPMRRRAA